MKRVGIVYQLDDLDKEIVQLSANGYNSKRIGLKTKRNYKTIQNRIDRMKFYYDCRTVAQLCIQLIHIKKLVLLKPDFSLS